MNILIINGSPRKNGLVSTMLDIMHKQLENKGDKVQVINANDLIVKPCIGCMVCRNRGTCVMPTDDAQRTLQMLQDADAVIIGAPCYWGNIPGTLKVLFDRMVYGMMRDTDRFPEPLMKSKRAIFVSTSTTPWPFNIWFKQTRGAIRALREITNYAGIKLIGTIEKGNTAKCKTLSNKEIAKCKKIADKLHS